jgi:hypothetical protein
MTQQNPAARPELVAPIIDSPAWMVVMVATEEFRQRQLRDLPRAASVHPNVSDPTRAQQNRLARDRLVTEDAVRCARRQGIPVIDVDGTRDANTVANYFRRYLPPPQKH